MANQIFVIKPYLWEGVWVFDDPDVGLVKEALVSGVPEIIEAVTSMKGIPNPEEGFVCVFSADYFPDHDIVLDWVREDGGGNIYSWNRMEGWLCPALFQYFDDPPEKLWIQVKPVVSESQEFEDWWNQEWPQVGELTEENVKELVKRAYFVRG